MGKNVNIHVPGNRIGRFVPGAVRENCSGGKLTACTARDKLGVHKMIRTKFGGMFGGMRDLSMGTMCRTGAGGCRAFGRRCSRFGASLK